MTPDKHLSRELTHDEEQAHLRIGGRVMELFRAQRTKGEIPLIITGDVNGVLEVVHSRPIFPEIPRSEIE